MSKRKKTAVVTGGASGMGAAESRLFAEQGARVFVADVQDAEGKALAKAIGEREEASLDLLPERRRFTFVEPQQDLVTVPRDHVAIVDRIE